MEGVSSPYNRNSGGRCPRNVKDACRKSDRGEEAEPAQVPDANPDAHQDVQEPPLHHAQASCQGVPAEVGSRHQDDPEPHRQDRDGLVEPQDDPLDEPPEKAGPDCQVLRNRQGEPAHLAAANHLGEPAHRAATNHLDGPAVRRRCCRCGQAACVARHFPGEPGPCCCPAEHYMSSRGPMRNRCRVKPKRNCHGKKHRCLGKPSRNCPVKRNRCHEVPVTKRKACGPLRGSCCHPRPIGRAKAAKAVNL